MRWEGWTCLPMRGKVRVHGEKSMCMGKTGRRNGVIQGTISLSLPPLLFQTPLSQILKATVYALILPPPPPPPPHFLLLLFWDSFCVCIEETSCTGHCWHCPSDCSLNHSQGIFMRWDHQVEMERSLLGVQIRCKTTSLQAFIIFCTPASLLIWSGTCHDQTRLTKNCPYKDIYLPVTLKCSQECVFVTFHQYSTLT